MMMMMMMPFTVFISNITNIIYQSFKRDTQGPSRCMRPWPPEPQQIIRRWGFGTCGCFSVASLRPQTAEPNSLPRFSISFWPVNMLYCHSSVQTFFNSNLRWWTQVVLAWDPIRGESSRPFSCLARVSYPDMQILNSLAVDLVASVIYDHAARRHALWNFVLVLAQYAIISIVFGGAE